MSPVLGALGVGARAYGVTATSEVLPSFELISTTNLTSDLSLVSINSIPSTYKHLQIRYVMWGTASGWIPQLRFNGDSSSNYDQNTIYGGSSQSAPVYGSSLNTSGGFYTAGVSNGMQGTSNYPTIALIDIADYANTSKLKVVRIKSAIVATGTSTNTLQLSNGYWDNTAAITSISLSVGGAAIATNSRISVYGIRG